MFQKSKEKFNLTNEINEIQEWIKIWEEEIEEFSLGSPEDENIEREERDDGELIYYDETNKKKSWRIT